MKDVMTILYWISLGVWITCCFITIFSNNQIPMWIALVVMNVINIWRIACKD